MLAMLLIVAKKFVLLRRLMREKGDLSIDGL